MAKGEGRNGGEDLFEDLDKFFAPIRDVDWPETSERPRRAEEGAEEPSEPQNEGVDPSGADADAAAFEAPIRVDRLEPSEPEEPEGDETVASPTPGQEDLFEPEAAESASRVEDEEEREGAEGVASFLFEGEAGEPGEAGEEERGEISEGSFAMAPGAYVDLPGPTEGHDESEAELVEDIRAAAEEAPDLQAVEAAAEHFAESVREEVRLEPAGDVTQPTEEVQIAELLGDEVTEEPPIGEPERARTVRVGGEGLGGPSWQEPTAVEVGADQERPPGRNVPMAFLTGLVLAGIALGAIAIGEGPFAVLAGAIVLFAQGEFYLALQRHHYQPATALGLVSGALVLGAGYYRGEGAILAIVGLATFAAFVWYMTVPAQHRRNVVSNVALTVLGVAYIPTLAAYAFITLNLPDGRALLISIIGLTFAYDTAAFGVGYFWGSRPLAAAISPKKSWEGAIGATLVVIAVSAGAVASSVEVLDTLGRSVGLAVVVAIFAPLGDLAESLLKRDLGIKDMGSILPGHGGVLDRIDSVLFVAPAAFLFLRLILL